jgi:glycine/D-amino acid oxidase-like deaminating enzyme
LPISIDYIIVGQGICGTLLSYKLLQAGKSVLVFDDQRAAAAWPVASGLINPITGQRLAKAWRIDELLPAAIAMYRELEVLLHAPLLTAHPLLEFLPDEAAHNQFVKRAYQYPEHLCLPAEEAAWKPFFRSAYSVGVIQTYLLNIQQLITLWRARLQRNQQLLEQPFNWHACSLSPQYVHYGSITAEAIISCEGTAAATNPFFPSLPLAINKGEALIVAIPGLPAHTLYHSQLKITPWQDGLFWVGTSFERSFTDPHPSAAFREDTEAELNSWLQLPFTTVAHIAGLRPSTMTREPVLTRHHLHHNLFLLNGMGAKGCSQAPFFVSQLLQQLGV